MQSDGQSGTASVSYKAKHTSAIQSPLYGDQSHPKEKEMKETKVVV